MPHPRDAFNRPIFPGDIIAAADTGPTMPLIKGRVIGEDWPLITYEVTEIGAGACSPLGKVRSARPGRVVVLESAMVREATARVLDEAAALLGEPVSGS